MIPTEYQRRRLSQCLEADEEEDDDSTATAASSSAGSACSTPQQGRSGAGTPQPIVPGRRHVSSKWIDTSLPPLRSPAPALISTLDPGDIWLQRASQVKVY
ncbi:hypothetical protein GE061_008163 [Apolygus lucorum]|uniref:Uncharacterized protein n=1 Tax=Apolygus lucorum TaxID=248454 RepID=A0A6A4IVX5_APOLU|nr:hypothetical protein GE061_008163 [Apolygus lucorum]